MKPDLLPSMDGLLEHLNQLPATDFGSLTTPDVIATYLERTRRPVPRPRGVEVDVVEDLVAGDRDVPVRVYQPDSETPLPALVYYHGGGWVIGDLEMHDDTCRVLANVAQCIVVSADYRLAPEHPFPVPLDDCWSVLRWAGDKLGERGWNGSTMAVAGTSSGGNLAAAVAQRARNEGFPLALQVLLYPALDSTMATASWRDFCQGYYLTAPQMQWYWEQYAADPEVRLRPELSPAQDSDLRGLAPSLVVTAECDLLRDEGEVYAARLREAGIPVRLWRFVGQIHGFLSLGASLPEVREAKVAIASLVGDALGDSGAQWHEAVDAPSGVIDL
jgi:acetyl esterase